MDSIEIYIISTDRGLSLTKEFYDLGLKQKYEVISVFIEMGLLTDSKFYDKVIKSVLQHSSKELKKEYPIRGDRKIRKAAQEADLMEQLHG